MRRVVGIIVAALFVLAAGALLYLDDAVGKFGECRIVRLTSIPSRDGSKSVITFRKECGATVPDSTHASVALTGTPFAPDKSRSSVFAAARTSLRYGAESTLSESVSFLEAIPSTNANGA